MTDKQIKQFIKDTVRETVEQLKTAGLLLGGEMSAVQKTEELLRQYPQLKQSDEPYARRVVAEIDACLAAAEQDPYIDAVRLFYFGGLKNAACASAMCYDETTVRKARRRLVRQFSTRLASEEFIRELLA